jgi:glyoxylase-like metal-dependent hydrolase (beta-lactamase superfamily II)
MTLHAVPLAPGLSYIDLHFLGRPNAIATAVISTAGSIALVDPGPTTCLETLELGLNGHGVRLADVTDILLTHIHLDHAGATGTIVRRHPHIRVLVHQRGATHLADPAKLLASATRLYGADMDRLWGEFAAVPERNLVRLAGGERIDAGGRLFEVTYTPGHASHHVSYFDRDSSVAFVGDTAGVRIDGGYVLPPTPPPDIDVESWRDSVTRIEAWAPGTLFLTHFGPVSDVRPHLQALLDNLGSAALWVKASLEEPGTDEERGQRYAEYLQRELRRHVSMSEGAPTGQTEAYRLAAPPDMLWLGLARYWRSRNS